ncbi:hypothetical protein LCGC14_1403750 [marine sediment metagenome]|uniref:Uncharacterized protein n=1 Tax=marine sediment metagenome TaxID=412755 RepID=A0A0F9JWB4_9ZZZZ
MGQTNVSREPEQFNNEPVRPTVEEYIETYIYKPHRAIASIIVRRGKTDFKLEATDKVPRSSPDTDVYIRIEEALDDVR